MQNRDDLWFKGERFRSFKANLVLFFFAIQLFMGLVVLPFFKIKTVFPFSQWDLFTSPPHSNEIVLVYVKSWNGRTAESAIEGHQFFSKYAPNVNYVEGHDTLTHEQSRLYQSPNTDFDGRVVQRVADIFFKNFNEVEFELRLSRIETLKFARFGTVESYRLIGTYKYSEGKILNGNSF